MYTPCLLSTTVPQQGLYAYASTAGDEIASSFAQQFRLEQQTPVALGPAGMYGVAQQGTGPVGSAMVPLVQPAQFPFHQNTYVHQAPLGRVPGLAAAAAGSAQSLMPGPILPLPQQSPQHQTQHLLQQQYQQLAAQSRNYQPQHAHHAERLLLLQLQSQQSLQQHLSQQQLSQQNLQGQQQSPQLSQQQQLQQQLSAAPQPQERLGLGAGRPARPAAEQPSSSLQSQQPRHQQALHLLPQKQRQQQEQHQLHNYSLPPHQQVQIQQGQHQQLQQQQQEHLVRQQQQLLQLQQQTTPPKAQQPTVSQQRDGPRPPHPQQPQRQQQQLQQQTCHLEAPPRGDAVVTTAVTAAAAHHHQVGAAARESNTGGGSKAAAVAAGGGAGVQQLQQQREQQQQLEQPPPPAGSTQLRALIDWRGAFSASPVSYQVLSSALLGHANKELPAGLQELRLGAFEVLLAESSQAANVAVEVLRSRMWDGVVAMDMQWKPDTGRDDCNPIALLQLSSAGVVVVIRTLLCGLPDTFRTAFVEDSDVELVVPAWSNNEERKLEESFGLQTFWCKVTDLQKVAKSHGHSKTGVKALVQSVLQPSVAMPKNKKNSLSDWSAPTLLPEQLKYAVLDAACIEHIYRCLEGRF